MAGTEQVPLLNDVDESAVPPPPPYLPGELETTEEAKPVLKPGQILPLPTYEQSQKYEVDGVLELDQDDEDQSETTVSQTMSTKPPGTSLDFTMFFLLCSFFGVVGFVFSICLAFTMAAESGALAGFGLALILKLFAFETYDRETVKDNFYHGGCEMYYGSNQTKEQCMHRLYYLTRLLFWFLGIFGVFLLCKGIHRYMSSQKRQPSPSTNVTVESD